MGASVVNALSSRLDVEVDRNGSTWAMSFRRGVPGVFDGDGPETALHPRRAACARSVACPRHHRHPRPLLARSADLPQGRRLSGTQLRERARQTTFLVPGLRSPSATTADPRRGDESFQHDGGISEFADYLAPDATVTEIIRLQGSERFTETVPMLDDKGHMTPQDVERDLDVDIALRWGTGYDTDLCSSFVNIIATPKGGTHVAGLRARRWSRCSATTSCSRATAC